MSEGKSAAQRREFPSARGEQGSVREWAAIGGGKGSCFHQALDRWASLRAEGRTHVRLALGVVGANPWEPLRHVHAWLEEGNVVVSAVTGQQFDRAGFYAWCPIERSTVRWVNPRKIVRRWRGSWDRDAITALLNLWGLPWRADVEGSGVLPAFERQDVDRTR